jgi:pimeloyl-ACP methyl ester carboxylesterase/predicted glycosyltransferase
MRACDPNHAGDVRRDDVVVHYEVFGEGEATVLFMAPWSIVPSQSWKAQVADLARHYRVLTFDGRGSGKSSHPQEPAAYADSEFAADALAVLDAVGATRAAVVANSRGARWALILAAEHPERVTHAIFIGPQLPMPLAPDPSVPRVGPTFSFTRPLDTEEGWAKFNRYYWLKDYRGFLAFFFAQVFSEPHATKQVEDCIGWGLETTPETLIASILAPNSVTPETLEGYARRVCCPVLVIHGTEDRVVAHAEGVAFAELVGGTLVSIAGGGHAPHGSDPVKVNLLLRDFIGAPQTSQPRKVVWTRARSRGKRALYISSPIGLGHVRRDLAIADHLRRYCPDLQIEWLAQHPVTQVLEARGEHIHPASGRLASEARHLESESAEHALNIFQSFRRMDDIQLANFLLFRDVAAATPYDVWIGDEAWELDHFLHENPEDKRAPYVWLTDFVGVLPMPEGGTHEAFLVADHNTEMLEHIWRYPYVRDRAIFVGDPEDIVPDTFGPGLPAIRQWTEQHYTFAGYIPGFDPQNFADRAGLRAELGYQPDEQVCIVAVGGSGVGHHLLRRVMEAYPQAKCRVPALRMLVVAGPRIAPDALPQIEGVEVRAYVHELYRHLAACDLAVVQGGLTTCMELTANKRPFLYFPLKHHFEQQFHVRYRLDRYGAGQCMDYDRATPDVIAAAITEEIGRQVTCRDVEEGGAARAAARIAELL